MEVAMSDSIGCLRQLAQLHSREGGIQFEVSPMEPVKNSAKERCTLSFQMGPKEPKVELMVVSVVVSVMMNAGMISCTFPHLRRQPVQVKLRVPGMYYTELTCLVGENDLDFHLGGAGSELFEELVMKLISTVAELETRSKRLADQVEGTRKKRREHHSGINALVRDISAKK